MMNANNNNSTDVDMTDNSTNRDNNNDNCNLNSNNQNDNNNNNCNNVVTNKNGDDNKNQNNNISITNIPGIQINGTISCKSNMSLIVITHSGTGTINSRLNQSTSRRNSNAVRESQDENDDESDAESDENGNDNDNDDDSGDNSDHDSKGRGDHNGGNRLSVSSDLSGGSGDNNTSNGSNSSNDSSGTTITSVTSSISDGMINMNNNGHGRGTGVNVQPPIAINTGMGFLNNSNNVNSVTSGGFSISNINTNSSVPHSPSTIYQNWLSQIDNMRSYVLQQLQHHHRSKHAQLNGNMNGGTGVAGANGLGFGMNGMAPYAVNVAGAANGNSIGYQANRGNIGSIYYNNTNSSNGYPVHLSHGVVNYVNSGADIEVHMDNPHTPRKLRVGSKSGGGGRHRHNKDERRRRRGHSESKHGRYKSSSKTSQPKTPKYDRAAPKTLNKTISKRAASSRPIRNKNKQKEKEHGQQTKHDHEGNNLNNNNNNKDVKDGKSTNETKSSSSKQRSRSKKSSKSKSKSAEDKKD